MSGSNANETHRFDGPPPGPPKSTRPDGFDQAPPPPPSPTAEDSEAENAAPAAPGDGASDTADVKATEVLKSMFDVVVAEADRNPRFAEALVGALPDKAIIDIVGTTPRKSSAQADFDLHSFSLVATYQKEGEGELREKLENLTKDQIIRMADAQSISLSNTQKRKRKSTIITATLNATRDRLADRFAASG